MDLVISNGCSETLVLLKGRYCCRCCAGEHWMETGAADAKGAELELFPETVDMLLSNQTI